MIKIPLCYWSKRPQHKADRYFIPVIPIPKYIADLFVSAGFITLIAIEFSKLSPLKFQIAVLFTSKAGCWRCTQPRLGGAKKPRVPDVKGLLVLILATEGPASEMNHHRKLFRFFSIACRAPSGPESAHRRSQRAVLLA